MGSLLLAVSASSNFCTAKILSSHATEIPAIMENILQTEEAMTDDGRILTTCLLKGLADFLNEVKVAVYGSDKRRDYPGSDYSIENITKISAQGREVKIAYKSFKDGEGWTDMLNAYRFPNADAAARFADASQKFVASVGQTSHL